MIINRDIVNLIEIKKSKFYVFLFNVASIESVGDIISKIKKDYKGANHYCYAYIIGNNEKCSDDGEPSGTAGLPILNILKYENLENILCVVVRFFGGVKLGAGGLIRAYASVTKDTINLIEKIENIKYNYCDVELKYSEIKNFEYKYKDYVVDKKFGDVIIYSLKVPENIVIKK